MATEALPLSSLASGGLAGPAARTGEPPKAALFWMLMLFFVLEYMRPPGIVLLRLQMVFILAVPVLWLLFSERPWSFNLSLQVAFLALSVAWLPLAYNYFAVYVGTRILFGNVVIALAITWLLATRRNFVRAAWLWVAVIGYQAIYALGHQGRGSGGFLGDENDLALACNTALPFAMAGALAPLRPWQRGACAAMVALLLAAVVASFSRGGVVGLGGMAVYLVLTRRNRIRNIGIALVAAMMFYALLPRDYRSEVDTILDTRDDTAEARFFLWAAATDMWLTSPIFGVGTGNFPFLVGFHQPEPTEDGWFSSRSYTERNWSMTVVHSLYFELLSEHGLLGLGLVGALVVGHFRRLRRLARDALEDPDGSPELRRDAELYSTALQGAMVGLLASGAFLSVTVYPYLWYLSAQAVALDRAIRSEAAAGGPLEASSPSEIAPGEPSDPQRDRGG